MMKIITNNMYSKAQKNLLDMLASEFVTIERAVRVAQIKRGIRASKERRTKQSLLVKQSKV